MLLKFSKSRLSLLIIATLFVCIVGYLMFIVQPRQWPAGLPYEDKLVVADPTRGIPAIFLTGNVHYADPRLAVPGNATTNFGYIRPDVLAIDLLDISVLTPFTVPAETLCIDNVVIRANTIHMSGVN